LAFLDARAPPSGGDVLTREPGGEYLDRRDGGPVDGADVVEVRDAGHPRGENLGDVRVGVGAPGDPPTAERGQHTEV
jgi:hypothetical protein